MTFGRTGRWMMNGLGGHVSSQETRRGILQRTDYLFVPELEIHGRDDLIAGIGLNTKISTSFSTSLSVVIHSRLDFGNNRSDSVGVGQAI